MKKIVSPIDHPQNLPQGIPDGSPKTTPPRPHKTLHRTRLINLMDSNQDKKLLLILGQAAQGKTTLAASFLAQAQRPYAWVNLSPDDSDPVTLFYALTQSLQSTFKETDFSPLWELPAQTLGPRAENPLYRDWVQTAFKLAPSPLLIVLDSLDRLSPQAPSWIFLQVLIEEVPAGIQVLLLSREFPPLNIQRLKMSQEAVVLTNDDLAFRPDEIKAFFKEVKGVPLSSDQSKKIHQHTQGWVGGLLIISESKDFHPEEIKNTDGLQRLLENIKDRMVDYFGEEIFSSQPGEIQDFWIKSSILEVIDPGVLKEIIENENTESLLDDLLKKNLFVSSTYDGEKGRLYLYHQLFRDFLQDKFKTRLTQEEQQGLFVKTASLMEKAGDLENALHFYLQAQEYSSACSILRKIWSDLFRQGKIGVLIRYLEALPADLIQQDPWILFCLCLTRRWNEARENISRLKGCLDIFEKQKEDRGVILTLAYLIEALMFQGGSWKEFHHFIEKGEELLASSSTEEMAYEKASLWFQIGMVHTIRGNLRKGFRACQKAYWLANKIGDLILQGRALSHSMTAMTYLGEYELTEDLAQKMRTLLKKIQAPDLSFAYFTTIGLLHIYRGEEEKARSAIQKSLDEVELHGLHYGYPIARLHQVMQAIFSNQYAKADQLGTYALELAETMGVNFVKAAVTTLLGINLFRQDLLPEAGERISRAITLLSADESGSEYHLHIAMALNSLICAERSKTSDGDDDLPKVLQYFGEIQAHLLLAESYLIAATIYSTKKQREKVTESLAAGFKIIQEKGYNHFLILRPKDVARVCALALEYEVPGVADCITGLLSTRYEPYFKPELDRLLNHPKTSIRATAREFGKVLHRSGVPLLRLETLGPFRVFRGETPMNDEEWEGNLSKKLLKAVLAFGTPKVPKDWLLETLWPNNNSSTAEKNLKITLHRLRKSLEPNLEEGLGSSYVHLNNNFVFLDEELCRIDAGEFLSLIQNGEGLKKKGGIEEVLPLYLEAKKIYQGDFLSEDIYEPWVQTRQETLKRKYIQLLLSIARTYETRGLFRPTETCYQEIIQADPLWEEAYQKLMLLYGNHGRPNKALKVYEDCRRTLETNLNVSPEELTTSIYKKIAGIS